MGKLSTFLRNPYVLFNEITKKHSLNWVRDELYIRLKFHAAMGKALNINNPQTYNEKLQWIKLYDHNPLYTKLVDKYEVKKYVEQLIGREYIIPTLGVWDSFNKIDFDSLPNSFVLKCTHDSGGLIIVEDKSNFDVEAAREKLQKCLGRNYYKVNREWPYKDVPPRIIAEEYMSDSLSNELKDYKFFCFDGYPAILFVASDRNKPGEDVKFDYFDSDFHRLHLRQKIHDNSQYDIIKPKTFDEMKRIASILSVNIPEVRIDLYEVDGKVYFGEYTFFHHGGMVPFIPESYDQELGSMIKLPAKKV